MFRNKHLGVIAIASCAFLAALPSQAGTGTETVGDFLMRIAHVKHLSADDAATAEAALRENGHALPELSHEQALLERDVVAISKALGLNLTTRTPQDRFTRAEIDRFVAVFGKELARNEPSMGSEAISLGNPDGKIRIRVKREPKSRLPEPL